MSEQRVCADFCHENRNCDYAKIVEENGKYPVVTFQAKVVDGSPDLTTMHNVKTRFDTTCYCVYCTHPSYPAAKFVGAVEPYFPCPVPKHCPLQKELQTVANKKSTILEKFKNFFIK